MFKFFSEKENANNGPCFPSTLSVFASFIKHGAFTYVYIKFTPLLVTPYEKSIILYTKIGNVRAIVPAMRALSLVLTRAQSLG
jgi:hypothetical protein